VTINTERDTGSAKDAAGAKPTIMMKAATSNKKRSPRIKQSSTHPCEMAAKNCTSVIAGRERRIDVDQAPVRAVRVRSLFFYFGPDGPDYTLVWFVHILTALDSASPRTEGWHGEWRMCAEPNRIVNKKIGLRNPRPRVN
jgi:hypothetical protein